MGKHLTIEEKLRLPQEFKKNKEKIHNLVIQRQVLKYENKAINTNKNNRRISTITETITELRKRQRKIQSLLQNFRRSKHNGLCYQNSVLYKKYGKKRTELTPEELTEYNRLKQRESRAKKRQESVQKYAKGVSDE